MVSVFSLSGNQGLLFYGSFDEAEAETEDEAGHRDLRFEIENEILCIMIERWSLAVMMDMTVTKRRIVVIPSSGVCGYGLC